MEFLVVEDREVLVLAVTLVALIAVLRCRRNLGPASGLLVAAISALTLALFATNVEEVVPDRVSAVVNIIEHVAYFCHTAFLVTFVLRSRNRSLVA